MRLSVTILCLFTVAAFAFSEEVKGEYTGTLYATEINSDHVNVRALPSLSAKVLFQLNHDDKVFVAGVSEKPNTINGQTAYWLLVEYTPKGDNQAQLKGWLFGAFAKDCQSLAPSVVSVSTYTPPTNRKGAVLEIQVERNGSKGTYKAYSYKLDAQPFVTFTWSADDKDFMYTDVPGTYVWYPDTNATKHICYLGTSMESAWVCFTDDLKYAFEDFGTSPGPRGLGVWTVPAETDVFSGGYYHSIELKDHEITVVYVYDDWNIKEGQIDKETAAHAKDFQRTHPMPTKRSDGLTNALLVKYRLNLNSRQRKFLDCEYVVTQ